MLLLARVRLTARRRLVAALAIGAVPVVALALWDYHRPPERRTHIGQFVAQIVDGQAGHVISRKISANLGQLGSQPVPAARRRHDRARRRRPCGGTDPWSSGPGPDPRARSRPSGASRCVPSWAALLNDSGVTVTGIMLSVALPAVTALALRVDPIDDR